MSESEESRHVIVTFGRSVTEEDLARLREQRDVLDAAFFRVSVDEDHVHTSLGTRPPVGDPAV